MRSEKREMRKVKITQRQAQGRVAIFLSFFFALFSFLFFLACPSPFSPSDQGNPWENTPPGKGSFSLSLSVAVRTIMPENAPEEKNFLMYRLEFTKTGVTGEDHGTDRSPAGLTAPVYLVEGTYKLVVTAYYDEDKTQPAARGSIASISIVANTSKTEVIVLKTIIDEPGTEGTFSFPVTLPFLADLVTAKMVITEFDDPTAEVKTVDLLTDSTRKFTLPTGYYDVEFTLLKRDNTGLVRREVLLIYSGLESEFKHNFALDNYGNMAYTVKFMDGNMELTELSTNVLHGDTITKPTPNPEKEKYTFDKWCSDSGTNNGYDFAAKVFRDTTLYAKWTSSAVAVESVTLPSTFTLFSGHSGTLTATIAPSDATYTSVSWSSNGTVATVTNTNSLSTTVTASSGTGSATITVNIDGKIATCTVTVTTDPGKGTVTEPYLVYDVETLKAVGRGTGSRPGWTMGAGVHYKLVANIEMGGESWIPIGDYSTFNLFEGIFDGDGKTISNLTIDAPEDDFQGLFAATVGEIKNLTLNNCHITGGNFVGGVAAGNAGTIENCRVIGGSITGTDDSLISSGCIGGVVGNNTSLLFDGGKVINCYSTCNVIGYDNVGGVVGYNGDIEGYGNDEILVKNCYSNGTISGNMYVGGVVGNNDGSNCDSTVENCNATGSVSGDTSVGGVVGGNQNGTVKNCYATISINGKSRVGGVVGSNSGTVENCHATDNITGIISNNYPYTSVGGVVGNNSGAVKNCYATGSVNGDESVGGVVGSNSGTVENCYATGNITGVSGLSTLRNYVGGVVGNNESGTVKNCYTTGDVRGEDKVGGVVGENNGTVENCYATGGVSGSASIGGVVGENLNLKTVKNCYATGDVSGNESVGGVVGQNNGTVENCYATGDVSGENKVGGVVGNNSGNNPLRNCVALNNFITIKQGLVPDPKYGRVTGFMITEDPFAISPVSPLVNNYGRSDMTGPNGGNWGNIGPTEKDGANVTPENAILQTWWNNPTTNGWNTADGASAWNFPGIWNQLPGGGILPTLRNMPGNTTQTPQIQN